MGLALSAWPSSSLLVILYTLACWAVFTGLLEIITALELRVLTNSHGWLGVIGAISLLLGVLLFVHPYSTVAVLVQIVGLYTTICGFSRLGWAFHLYTRSRLAAS